MVELSLCSKGGQGEGEATVIAHQPGSQGIEPGTIESADQEESPEPLAPRFKLGHLPPPPPPLEPKQRRIGSAATATGSFLLGTAGVHQIIMKFSQHHRKMHQN